MEANKREVLSPYEWPLQDTQKQSIGQPVITVEETNVPQYQHVQQHRFESSQDRAVVYGGACRVETLLLQVFKN